MNHSEHIDKISPALVLALAELDAVTKDSSNPFFNSKYADINSILRAAKPILAKHNLGILQPTEPDREGVLVSTTILHSSGQWIGTESIWVPAAKHDPQGYGSAITYARRYSLTSLLGVEQEDDDGNSASASMSKVEAARAAAAARRQKSTE